jgi:putative MFS transporter
MASDFAAPGNPAASGKPAVLSRGMILARQDRILVWAFPWVFLIVLGMGFIFTFYDIFDVNVSFIQTCVQIVPKCTPASASPDLALATLLNLVGYVIGALSLTSIADRFGRRNTMLMTLTVTAIGALYSALSPNLINFYASRFLTGIGIGADLAVVNTYIGEMAPRTGRARFTALIVINSSLGAFLGIWLGLVLTTAPTPFPLGLPFAVGLSIGWRLMYFIAVGLCIVGILVRLLLPESSRWLVSMGQLQKADAIVRRMEAHASRKQALPEVTGAVEVHVEREMGYAEIFSNPLYVRRMVLLLGVWLLAYVTVYTVGAGLTAVLASLGYPPPEAGLIAAIGVFGFIAIAIFVTIFGEALERKHWLPIMAIVTLIGGILIAVAGQPVPHQIPWGAFVGSFIIFAGFNGWVPQTYAWSAENFPTRARATGFGIVDGAGHVGGGIGLMAIAPILPGIGALASFVLIAGFLIVAAIIAQFGVATRGKDLEVISP